MPPRLEAVDVVCRGVSLFGGRGRVCQRRPARIARDRDHRQRPRRLQRRAQYIITAAILLAAVTLDTRSRRRLAASGR
jgi:hypothetical protein